MKNSDKDILKDFAELKENAHAVPERYFEELKANLKMIPHQEKKSISIRWKWVSSVAASLVLLLAAGGFYVNHSSDGIEFTEEDYIAASEELTYILMHEYYDQYAQSQEITEDDIIDYLIYSGIEVEEIENY